MKDGRSFSSTKGIPKHISKIPISSKLPMPTESRAVTQRDELDDAIAEMLSHQRTYLLEVVVETKGMVYPMVPAGGNITNIIMGNGYKFNSRKIFRNK